MVPQCPWSSVDTALCRKPERRRAGFRENTKPLSRKDDQVMKKRGVRPPTQGPPATERQCDHEREKNQRGAATAPRPRRQSARRSSPQRRIGEQRRQKGRNAARIRTNSSDYSRHHRESHCQSPERDDLSGWSKPRRLTLHSRTKGQGKKPTMGL